MTADDAVVPGVAYRARLGDVSLGFTDARLDVAETAADRDTDLATAIDLLAPRARAVRMHQVHGSQVAVVGGGEGGSIEGVDALVTAEPGVALVVRAADCVPVVLADAEAGVVGVAHAGRAGVVRGVVSATVAVMRRLGAHGISAWIGPAVCGGCYEVPAALREEVASVVGDTRAETTWGTPALDLVAGVRSQLADAGVDRIEHVARCTREDPDLHSYRRDGAAAGRSAGIVVRSPEAR